MRTPTEFPPSFAAAQAWFAPLPPGNIWKFRPSTVSPGAGKRSTPTTKSMLRLPTTTIAGFIGLPGQVDAQFFQFLGVIALLQQVPFLAALGNLALLRPDLFPRQAIHFLFRNQQLGHGAHDLEPHFVGISLDAQF